MKMKTLRFTTNWALKLDNKKYFTTLRLDKGFYKAGEKILIELKGDNLGIACIKSISLSFIENLPNTICYLDTGYSSFETQEILKKMYPDENCHLQKIAIILLEWIERIEPKAKEQILNTKKPVFVQEKFNFVYC